MALVEGVNDEEQDRGRRGFGSSGERRDEKEPCREPGEHGSLGRRALRRPAAELLDPPFSLVDLLLG